MLAFRITKQCVVLNRRLQKVTLEVGTIIIGNAQAVFNGTTGKMCDHIVNIKTPNDQYLQIPTDCIELAFTPLRRI